MSAPAGMATGSGRDERAVLTTLGLARERTTRSGAEDRVDGEPKARKRVPGSVAARNKVERERSSQPSLRAAAPTG